MQRTASQTAAEADTADDRDRRLDPEATLEAVRLRNYDHWQGHSVRVAVSPPGGEPVIEERHFLAADRTARVAASVAPGEYEVAVRVDGVELARTTVALDATAAGTAVVELGNGVVSLTEGG